MPLPQRALAFAKGAHTWPQLPQLTGSVPVLVSQSGVVSQFEKPGRQGVMHIPRSQRAIPPALRLHTVEHVPQRDGSVARSVSQIPSLSQSARKPGQIRVTQEPATHCCAASQWTTHVPQ